MVGDGIDVVQDERLDLRSRQTEYKRRLLRPIASTEELVGLLCSPLVLFDVVPDVLRGRQENTFRGCTEKERSKALAATTWASDVQTIILEKILLDWDEALKSKELLEIILRSWFAPNIKERDNMTQLSALGSLHIATLSTISSMLSNPTSQAISGTLFSNRYPFEKAQRPEASSHLITVIRLFIGNFSLNAVIASITEYHSGVKKDLVWNDVIRELVALPERAANASNGHPPLELQRKNYIHFIANQLGELLQRDCQSKYTSTLVSKLHRAGYFQDTTVGTEEPANLWPSIIRDCIGRSNTRWSGLLAEVSAYTRSSIVYSLFTFIDRYSFKQNLNSTLLTAEELERPGSEGSIFLSSQTWQSALRIASVIEILLRHDPKEVAGRDSDSESEEKDSLLLKIILPSATYAWSPLTARLLIHLFTKMTDQSASTIALDKIIEAWSSSSRIKKATWEQEVYCTIVLLLLFGEVSMEAKSKLRTSAIFINGVSSHLEHYDSKHRRMGMLVAEVISSAGATDKALSFGKSIWDGKGEGKEEARVLRAVYHGWKDREQTFKGTVSAQVSTAFGLNGNRDVIKCAKKSVSMPERTAPKTRKLPLRRPAAPKKRIMIETLDGDEADCVEVKQEDLLPPLTQIQGRPKYISESEGSSSSEDETDDSEIESMIPPIDSEKKEEFGMGIPQKKKKRPPVYINELSPLFQEQEREANKLALRHAEELIKRKAGWGSEVDENAIDLAIAIIALNNNFGFKKFEERKRTALTALVCASPRIVAPCLVEQFFNMQYSISQRVCILNALAFGARQITENSDKDHNYSLHSLAQDISQLSMTRSRIQGEQRMPEIQRERSLLVNKQSVPRTLDATTNTSRLTGYQTKNVYLDLAASAFIFPLINRFHAQIQQHHQLSSTRYKRGGSGILFDPFLLSAFLDTLTVLCYCAQNVGKFSSDIVPEVMELALAITNLTLSKVGVTTDQNETNENSFSILGATANLLLVLLDAVSEKDNGQMLLRNHAQMVKFVENWAAALFESIDGQGDASGNRAGSGAAAILLCIDKMKQNAL